MIYTVKLEGDERFAIDNIKCDLWNEGWDVLEDDSGFYVIESKEGFNPDCLTDLFRIYIGKNKVFLVTCYIDDDADMVFKVYAMDVESYKNEWESIISQFKPAKAIEFNRGYEIALTDSNGFLLCHFDDIKDVEEYAKAKKLAINWSKFAF